MKIDTTEFVTQVQGLKDLSELVENADKLGQPCLLMVYPSENALLTSGKDEKAIQDFFADAAFMTAVVTDENANISEQAISLFDLKVSSENADEYADKLFNEKTKKQVDEITACFTAARKGSAQEVLDCESRAFYRLMAEKNGGDSNE